MCLDINEDYLTEFKNTIDFYAFEWEIAKWAFIGVGITAVLFFNGVLGNIPLTAPVVAKLIFTVAPIIAFTLASFWYSALEPLSVWAVDHFFYPDYSPADEVDLDYEDKYIHA